MWKARMLMGLSAAVLATSCQYFAAISPVPRPTPMPMPSLAPLTEGVRLIVDSQLIPTERMADRLLLGRSSYNTPKGDNRYEAGVIWVGVNGSDKPEWYDLGLSLKTKGGAPIKSEYTESDFEDVQFALQIVKTGTVYQRSATAKFWPGETQPMTTGTDQPSGSTLYHGKYATAHFKGGLERISGYVETPMVVPSPYPEPHTSTVRFEFNVPLPKEDASQIICQRPSHVTSSHRVSSEQQNGWPAVRSPASHPEAIVAHGGPSFCIARNTAI